MQSEQTDKKGRDIFWQAVRGVCMLAVVMIHCPSASSYAINSPEFAGWMVLRQMIDFPVAVFFFLSGYFVNQKKVVSDPKAYIIRRGGYLLVPYLLWTIVYNIVSIIRNLSSGDVISWRHYILDFLTGGAAAPFYYIVCLLQLTVLTPLIIKWMRRSSWFRNLMWFITPVYLLGIYLCQIFVPELDIVLSNKGLFFPAWLLFYCLGIYAKDGGLDEKSEQYGKPRFIVIGFALECAESAIIVSCGLGGTFASSQLKFSSYLYVVIICLWLLKLSKGKYNTNVPEKRQSILLKGFRYIGDRSYGIFYIHCLILIVVNKIIGLLGIGNSWPFQLLIVFVVTVTASVIVIDITHILFRKIGSEKALKWIGF